MSCHDSCCRAEQIESRLLARRFRAARKPHRCVMCGLPIGVGERYVHEVAIVDGDFYTADRHDGYGCPAVTL